MNDPSNDRVSSGRGSSASSDPIEADATRHSGAAPHERTSGSTARSTTGPRDAPAAAAARLHATSARRQRPLGHHDAAVGLAALGRRRRASPGQAMSRAPAVWSKSKSCRSCDREPRGADPALAAVAAAGGDLAARQATERLLMRPAPGGSFGGPAHAVTRPQGLQRPGATRPSRSGPVVAPTLSWSPSREAGGTRRPRGRSPRPRPVAARPLTQRTPPILPGAIVVVPVGW